MCFDKVSVNDWKDEMFDLEFFLLNNKVIIFFKYWICINLVRIVNKSFIFIYR